MTTKDEIAKKGEELKKQYGKQYKSPKYDPVKAHEYYEKHKKLKGRNKKGKSKSKSKTKKAKKVTFKDRVNTDSLNQVGLEQAYRAKAEMTVKMNNFNKKLTELLKGEIEKLKGLNDTEKAIQSEMLKQKFSDIKKQAKDLFNEEYAQKMDSIKKDKSMLK